MRLMTYLLYRRPCAGRAVSVFFLFLALGLLTAVSGGAGAADTSIKGIRFGENAGRTRIVLDVSQATTPRLFLLQDPNRVVIDLAGADWLNTTPARARGVVARYRHGLFSADTYRIVLDLSQAAVIARSFTLPPNGKRGYRLVIDLEPADQDRFLAAVAETRKARQASRVPEHDIVQTPVRRASDKRVIVVDPGHGGIDPGTLGVLGVNEKIITLRMARVIRKELAKNPRYEVHLTRDRDIFIPLRKRIDIARRHGAELFISVHADAIKNPKVRGGTVYTLSETSSDREAARLAAKENKSDLIAGLNLEEAADEVSSILIELAQRETMNYSAEFAGMLLPEMRREVVMHKRGHRFAGFVVLKAPDVPSVLIETGYLSNRADARVLDSAEGRLRIARAIRRATDKYFERLTAMGR